MNRFCRRNQTSTHSCGKSPALNVNCKCIFDGAALRGFFALPALAICLALSAGTSCGVVTGIS